MSHERSPAQLESHFAMVARYGAHGDSQTRSLTTLLHIGDEQAAVLSGQGDRPDHMQQIGLGAVRIARDYFHHDPPTSHEIELAIDFVEDEIMRLGKPLEDTTTLWSTSTALRAWSALAGPTLAIETVEQWFQRLVSASRGQPAAIQGLPPGRDAAATLLVLREFMHHRGHATIVLVEAPDAAAPHDDRESAGHADDSARQPQE
jgi:hypothetical protein